MSMVSLGVLGQDIPDIPMAVETNYHATDNLETVVVPEPVAFAPEIPNPGEKRVGYLTTLIINRHKRTESEAKEISDAIFKSSQEFNMDPGLITSLVATESGFNAKARSHKNARGLMQVRAKTETGKNVWFSDLVAYGIIKTEQDLHKPLAGIRAGCFVFQALLNLSKGNTNLALSRYLGGNTQSAYVQKVKSYYHNNGLGFLEFRTLTFALKNSSQ